MNVLVISGCSVWCKLFGWIFFGFFLGSMVMYLCSGPHIQMIGWVEKKDLH
jgi:hypothetical protein